MDTTWEQNSGNIYETYITTKHLRFSSHLIWVGRWTLWDYVTLKQVSVWLYVTLQNCHNQLFHLLRNMFHGEILHNCNSKFDCVCHAFVLDLNIIKMWKTTLFAILYSICKITPPKKACLYLDLSIFVMDYWCGIRKVPYGLCMVFDDVVKLCLLERGYR